MKETSAYNTPERNTARYDNKPLLPPPRKPVSSRDTGLQIHKGVGTKGMGYYPRYRSAEALKYSVDLYFDKKMAEKKHFTLAGLALSLGFKSVKSLKAYAEKGDDYETVIETARTRIEEDKNDLLLEGGRATNGVIFDLKNNHEWTDRLETRTTHDVGDTLARLVMSLQGKVLRPGILHTIHDDIVDGAFIENYDGKLSDLTGFDFDDDVATATADTHEDFA